MNEQGPTPRLRAGWIPNRRLARAAALSCGCALVLAALATPALAMDTVPEIDPGSLGGALTLLGGGALILASRLRRR